MPSMDADKRGSGQRVNDTAGTWKHWRCHECGRGGREIGARAARSAFERHWMQAHQQVDF